ncbi:TPA: hypothetical protein RM259_001737 [Escherichia coli]|uniref:hypothetical protein n=1 Tax=Escherichia TaxID=561 RepID=UPI0012FFF44C|nr:MULTISPECIES: hypothetical protein [Escherichia]EFA7191294.1 hypothetical protein [Escherichia coli]EFH5079486.1 hypothetical protein [Escherichia coli]EJC7928412.1 hypothetical protein [Escherichia coli]HBI7891656.1 hypothetical protein [Escherichia coli]HDW7345818.1 hypothetical protein [Escherichia coli]
MLSLVYENPWTTVFFADCSHLLPYQYYWRIARQVTTMKLTQTGNLNAGFFMRFLSIFCHFQLRMHYCIESHAFSFPVTCERRQCWRALGVFMQLH